MYGKESEVAWQSFLFSIFTYHPWKSGCW